MGNMFYVQRKEMPGKVVVKTRPSPLIEGSTIYHITRNVADDAVVTTEMTEHTDIVKAADMTAVMAAFVKSVQTLVAEGNAVRVSGLGTFYLTVKETEGSKKGVEGEEGKTEFGVGFAPDKSLTEAARKAEAHVTMQSESKPVIETITNMDTMEENSIINGDKFAILEGERMRVAGDEETGIYMVPCDENDNYKDDMSDWVKASEQGLRRNAMKSVVFRVPQVTGRYRIAIVTKAPLNGSKREDKLLKHNRVGVSMAVDVV